MQDPARIPRIINKLHAVWSREPDLRLGHLISLLAREETSIFEAYDDRIERELDKCLDLVKDERRPHIVGGEFQSDKYPTCPPGKVPLSVKDPMAQDLLWEYARRRRTVDPAFASDLEWALIEAGYILAL